MIEVRSYLRALVGRVVDPAEILAAMNDLLVHSPTPRFVTLMVGSLDEQSRVLRYASAGHQGYIMDKRGEIDLLSSTGLPLGCVRDVEYSNGMERMMHPGDVVLLPTDGIQETLSPHHDLFGTKRMLDVVHKNRSLPAADIIAALHAAALRFAQGAEQQDDIAAVVVKFG